MINDDILISFHMYEEQEFLGLLLVNKGPSHAHEAYCTQKISLQGQNDNLYFTLRNCHRRFLVFHLSSFEVAAHFIYP